MKYLLKNIACAILLLSVFNCTTEPVGNNQELNTTQSQESTLDDYCSGQSPKARITNNGTVNVNLEIFNEAGSLIGHDYGVTPGQTSDWSTFATGVTTFVVSNVNSDKIIVIDMDTCMAYDMVIGTNNQLTSDQPIHL